MKYPKEQWLSKPDDIKIRTIEEELELVTHNGTTKEDLLMMLRWTFQREQAAVEDMKRIVDAVREKHGDETCCFACKYDADMSITDSGSYANECPGFDRDDCFDWRGTQNECEIAENLEDCTDCGFCERKE